MQFSVLPGRLRGLSLWASLCDVALRSQEIPDQLRYQRAFLVATLQAKEFELFVVRFIQQHRNFLLPHRHPSSLAATRADMLPQKCARGRSGRRSGLLELAATGREAKHRDHLPRQQKACDFPALENYRFLMQRLAAINGRFYWLFVRRRQWGFLIPPFLSSFDCYRPSVRQIEV
jgi:hypothetical protein